MSRVYLQAAVEMCGGQSSLGRMIGYSQNAIHIALKTGNVSPLMAYRIHIATKAQVDFRKLCPLLDTRKQLRLARKQVNGAAA